MIQINSELCNGCGLCRGDCFAGCITMINGKAAAAESGCMQCGHCVALCPQQAIVNTNYPTADLETYQADTFAVNPQNLLHLMKYRRSIRQFKPDAIAHNVLEQLVQAGRFAPTGSNRQDVSLTIVEEKLAELKPLIWQTIRKTLQDAEKPSAFLQKLLKAYDEDGQDGLFFTAPAVMVITAHSTVNGSLAAAYIELLANALNLGVLYSGFISAALRNNKEARALLDLAGKPIVICLVLGYPNVTYRRTAPRKAADVVWK
ncbi:MAG: nitroreductase family protein [Negativicutes bacterium]|nr:nitroreductase family protein [Negativicutes bacterium]